MVQSRQLAKIRQNKKVLITCISDGYLIPSKSLDVIIRSIFNCVLNQDMPIISFYQ